MSGSTADNLNPDGLERAWVEAAVREAKPGLSEARQRVWAADYACYYAHRRYV